VHHRHRRRLSVRPSHGSPGEQATLECPARARASGVRSAPCPGPGRDGRVRPTRASPLRAASRRAGARDEGRCRHRGRRASGLRGRPHAAARGRPACACSGPRWGMDRTGRWKRPGFPWRRFFGTQVLSSVPSALYRPLELLTGPADRTTPKRRGKRRELAGFSPVGG